MIDFDMSYKKYFIRIKDVIFNQAKLLYGNYSDWIYISGIALLLRVILILTFPIYPVSDAKTYYDSAIGIIEGNGYTVWGNVSAYFPPGYPGFVALILFVFGKSLIAAQMANAFLSVGTALIMAKIGMLLGLTKKAGLFVLIMIMFYPEHIAYSMILATEQLALFLLVYATFLLIKQKKRTNVKLSIGAGLLFGLASLTKSQIVLLVPLIIFSIYWPSGIKKIFKIGMIVIFFMFTIILPWTARNKLLFNKPIFIASNGPINLFIGNNPNSSGTYDEMGFSLLENKDPGIYALDYIKTNLYDVISKWPKKIEYLFLGFQSTGLDSLWQSIPPKRISTEEYEKIKAFVKSETKRELIATAYIKQGNGNYALHKTSVDTLIEVAEASLYSGVTHFPNTKTRILMKGILFFWFLMMISIGAIGAKIQPPLHFLFAAYFIVICIVFFGLFRFNFLFTPWFAIPFSKWLDSSINRLKDGDWKIKFFVE